MNEKEVKGPTLGERAVVLAESEGRFTVEQSVEARAVIGELLELAGKKAAKQT